MSQNPPEATIGISSLAYELGELKRELGSISDAEQRFKALKLPMNSALLGCKYFRQSTRGTNALVAASIEKTLRGTDVAPADIDMLIVASADPRCLGDSLDMTALLESHGLSNAMPLGMTLQECSSLLSAFETATRYLHQSSLRNILVVSVDIAHDDAGRIQLFGVLSDAATSCLVSKASRPDFQIVGFAGRADIKGMKGLDGFASRKLLSGAVTDQVMKNSKVTIADVRKVFSTNFFMPVAQFNAATLGLRKDQVYFDCTAEIAHCACADPLVNLCHFRLDNELKPGELFLLQSYAPGFVVGMLVKSGPGADA